MFRHVSKSGQTLGNISEKHRETSNVSEFVKPWAGNIVVETFVILDVSSNVSTTMFASLPRA
jgi:hypothetical protein